MNQALPLFISSFLIVSIQCLNLRHYGISDHYYTSSIAVYRNRAFLTLPRSSCFNNHTQPTLIEVQWNGDRQYLTTGRRIYFPHETSQTWGKCISLQDAVSVEVEVKKGRLWVLDKGSSKCPAKVLVYNLINNLPLLSSSFNDNKEGRRMELSFMVIDPKGPYGTRAYITDSYSNTIIVFCLGTETWSQIEVQQFSGGRLPFTMRRLVLSKTEPKLYITSDESHEMACINVTTLQNTKNEDQSKIETITAISMGEKLGPSAGMNADLAGGLNYYSTRDFAILRWDTRKPLQAEYHEVLFQSYEWIPYVSHIFSTSQNEIWALINPAPPSVCQLSGNQNNTTLPESYYSTVRRRVLRLSKFIKIGRKANLVFIIPE